MNLAPCHLDMGKLEAGTPLDRTMAARAHAEGLRSLHDEFGTRPRVC
jgi:hypothetical protein